MRMTNDSYISALEDDITKAQEYLKAGIADGNHIRYDGETFTGIKCYEKRRHQLLRTDQVLKIKPFITLRTHT